MQDQNTLPLKDLFLRSLIVSVAISAFLGIIAILVGTSDFTGKILATSFTLSGASLMGLCCGAAIEVRQEKLIPYAGILFAGLSAVVLILGIWLEFRSIYFAKILGIVALVAFGLSHLSLLMLAWLAEKYQWAMYVAYAAVFSLVILISGLIWWEPYYHKYNEVLTRIIGILVIVDTAITILIPVFHRFSQEELQTDGDELSLEEIEREMVQLKKRLAELEAMKRAAD